jgi:hypothetical protein
MACCAQQTGMHICCGSTACCYLPTKGNEDVYLCTRPTLLPEATIFATMTCHGCVASRKAKIHFRRAMLKLHDYNLVNVVAGSYQVHPCLHDWLVESLNTPLKSLLFITALTCIAYSVEDESRYGILAGHPCDEVDILRAMAFEYRDTLRLLGR